MKKLDIEKLAKETLWWKRAAWTMPFVALAIVVTEHFIGHDDWIDITLCAIIITFVACSVFWWWWAIDKIVNSYKRIENAVNSFEEIKTDLKETAKQIRKK